MLAVEGLPQGIKGPADGLVAAGEGAEAAIDGAARLIAEDAGRLRAFLRVSRSKLSMIQGM